MVNTSGSTGKINQDDFNKFVTTITLFFFLFMYFMSWYTGKSVDLTALAGFLVPVIAHSTHLISNSVNQRTDVSKMSVANEIIKTTDGVSPITGGPGGTVQNGK